MPRQARKRRLYDGALYHIINRGHNKSLLYRDTNDFNKFRRIVGEYKKKYTFDLYHYCFMPNHFHMIMKIKNGRELPLLMKRITLKYVNYYRERYKSVGNVFQGRYKSILIEKEEYLLECSRYIERNPLRAGVAKDIKDYPWSSYHYYAAGAEDYIVSTDPMYSTFGVTPEERYSKYADFVFVDRLYEQVFEKILGELI